MHFDMIKCPNFRNSCYINLGHGMSIMLYLAYLAIIPNQWVVFVNTIIVDVQSLS